MLNSKGFCFCVVVPIICLMCAVSSARADDLWPSLSSPPKATGGGEKDAAVIVGAEKYAFVEPVPGAKENANAWQAYLTDTLRVPAEKVALLRDDEATNDDIRQAAIEKTAQVEPGGTLWFVFIGHGAPSRDGRDGLLVGVDAQRKAESVYNRSLSRNELLGLLANGKQEKTVVLIDACFSGKAPSGRDLVANLQPLVPMLNLPQGLDKRTILLTAAKSDQFAGPLPKADELRPAFSYLALGAMRGWAADAKGRVTALGIVDYAKKALSLAHDRTQTPELSAGLPGTVLGRGRENAPDLGKIDREADARTPGLRYDGVYKSKQHLICRHFIRFYQDDTVTEACMQSEPDQEWFTKVKGSPDISSGKAVIRGSELSFSGVSTNGTVDYIGEIFGDHIHLRSYSHINGHRGEDDYDFVKW